MPVEEWLRKVEEIESHVKKFDSLVEEHKRYFLQGKCCPQLSSRYKLSKEAVEKIRAIRELQKDGRFNTISHIGPPPGMDQMPDGDFVAFNSTVLAMNQIMKALNNSDINIVGVYGMPGVGKTMLIKEVGRLAKKECTFEDVVMVAVSQHQDLKKIQREIAEELGLNLGDESKDLRARRLFARLKQQKKVLIILDDLWSRLELREVGIPCGVDHSGCKVVVTTRRL